MSSSPTDFLYQRDSYVRTWDATIIGADRQLRAVALDRSAFYPGGGGQPSDHGTLTDPATGATWPVVEIQKGGSLTWHILGGDAALPHVGTPVRGALDWDRRYRLMRTHTALHVLCGMVYRDYGALVTGGNMDIDKMRMDFEITDFTPEVVAEIEQRANAEIARELDVKVQILPREVAFQIPDLIRTKINLLPEGITEVRTVEIVGLDLQADGGTHVANTREVGGLRVVGTRSKGKSNKRLELVLTGRDGDESAPTA